MPACRPICLALALAPLLLVFPALSGASPSPGSDPHPRIADAETVPADLITGMSARSDEIVVSLIHEAQLGPEVTPDSDRAGQSAEKDRRAGIREWAARLLQRCEAEITRRHGRIAVR